MDVNTEEVLKKAGIDTDDAMERFMGNEAMYEKYLVRFVGDKTFENLLKAVADKDWKKAFEATHTLKGTTGTLSISSLFALFSKQTEAFRAGNIENGVAMMDEIKAEYKKIVDAIGEICGK